MLPVLSVTSRGTGVGVRTGSPCSGTLQHACSEGAGRQQELRLAIDHFDTFARRIHEGLEDADWETRRQIVTALVKQVEVEQEQIRVIYRLAPAPVDRGSGQRDLQDCPVQRDVRSGE
jgi:site-specific DNA recombinase